MSSSHLNQLGGGGGIAINNNSSSSINNSKKGGSGGSSAANTPAQTPNLLNGQGITHSTPPPISNAPKYGTLVPNRIFVGGISANTTEGELLQLFSQFGTVKAAKIIQDRAGVSKGYGFITFETEEDAKRLQRESDNIVLRERKLNIAPAIKKQPFSRCFDASSPSAMTASTAPYYFPPGATMPFFQGGVAYYPQPPAPPTDASASQQAGATVYQQPQVYQTQSAHPQAASYPSVMFPPPYYMQQYPMHMPYEYFNFPPNGAPPPYLMGTAAAAAATAPGNQGAQHQQSGSGGPSLVQPAGSPPRHQHQHQHQHHGTGSGIGIIGGGYGGQQQQLSTPYNNSDIFFNFPMYGGMEGPTMYSDGSLDMANGNPFAEESYFMVDGIHASVPDIDIIGSIPVQSPPPLPSYSPASCSMEQQQPPINKNQNNTSAATRQQQQQQQQQQQSQQQPDTTRQTTTPVVSLLSLDQRHEKDFTAMQGGRRRKSAPPPAQQPPHYHQQQNYPTTNGFIPPYANYHSPPVHDFHHYHNTNKKMTNGYPKKKQQHYRGSYESPPSVSSDSNSTCPVDENRNEEKNFSVTVTAHSTNVSSPPPAPYSPISNHQNYNKWGRGRGNNGTVQKPRKFYPSNKHEGPVASHDGMNMIGTPQHFAPPSRSTTRNMFGSGGSGGSGGSSGSGGINRRYMRRNTTATIPITEIGAGDAPLPGTDVLEVCKKLESIKL